VNLNVAQYIDQTPTILSLIRAGLGLGILPASAQRFHYDNVEFRSIANNSMQAEMSMAWRSDQDNPAVTAFRLMAAEYFATKARA
jgi:DNA-binding transcriptional LysR family regulator